MPNERILLLSGPNLDQLGTRQPDLYGASTLEDHVRVAREAADQLGYELDHMQSASEAELIAAIHRARTTHVAIVINAGAFTHYAWALHDALLTFEGPKVELHITNTGAREDWRKVSVIAGAVTGSITGMGKAGYRLSIEAVGELLSSR